MKREFTITHNDQVYTIPNTWEALSQQQFERLLVDIARMAAGELSAGMVKANYLCDLMQWDITKIDDEGLANLVMLAEQISFIFNITYPDGNAALEKLDPEARKLFSKTPPEQVTGHTIARYLSRLEYTYTLDACFCAQLVPTVTIGKNTWHGYQLNTSFGTLTCSLIALQFIEARELMGADTDRLPLLAAILYYPGVYNSAGAHELAETFRQLPEITLQAISLNFLAVVNYLFTRTEFSILTAAKVEHTSGITTGALESLYNLSADGIGDITTVEQMNLIQYLILLRKKLIEAVRSLAGSDMDRMEIADRTGLPLPIINSILK
ncbi:MAG: hypothetical protein LIP08_02940 [Bacteroides sp.]|nr:hypothetical protein [Bacteroides sp.]